MKPSSGKNYIEDINTRNKFFTMEPLDVGRLLPTNFPCLVGGLDALYRTVLQAASRSCLDICYGPIAVSFHGCIQTRLYSEQKKFARSKSEV